MTTGFSMSNDALGMDFKLLIFFVLDGIFYGKKTCRLESRTVVA